jgi:hypothetical protein
MPSLPRLSARIALALLLLVLAQTRCDAAADIVSISPTQGSSGGDTQVVISGSGFQQGITVTFGATAAQQPINVSVDGTTITCTAPAHAPGTVDVIVRNALGDTDTLAFGFTYIAVAPVINSPKEANATAGTPFTYTITTAAGTTPITFTAENLPAGLSLNGAVISGTPEAAGGSEVVLTATNSVGSNSLTLLLSVYSTTTGDTDNDGFRDELENGLGTDPTLASSTPFDGAPAGTVQALTDTKLQIKLNFKSGSTGKDQAKLQGVLPVPANFQLNQAVVVVDIGGVIRKFTLDEKGKAMVGNDLFKLNVKGKKDALEAQDGKFIAQFRKGTFADKFTDEHLVNDTVEYPTTVILVVLFDTKYFEVNKPVEYKARKFSSGSAKSL